MAKDLGHTNSMPSPQDPVQAPASSPRDQLAQVWPHRPREPQCPQLEAKPCRHGEGSRLLHPGPLQAAPPGSTVSTSTAPKQLENSAWCHNDVCWGGGLMPSSHQAPALFLCPKSQESSPLSSPSAPSMPPCPTRTAPLEGNTYTTHT